MNSKQKLVLSIFVLATAGMMLYPPFQVTFRGTELNMGYGFLFDPPKRGSLTASVNVPVLLAQWVAALLVSGVGWLLVRGEANSATPEPRVRDPQNKSFSESSVFGSLRLCRGIIGFISAWQVIGFLPVLTWLSNTSAITSEMVVIVTLKATVMVVFGLMFLGMRKIIHRIHHRWYGSPHPSLTKALAL